MSMAFADLNNGTQYLNPFDGTYAFNSSSPFPLPVGFNAFWGFSALYPITNNTGSYIETGLGNIGTRPRTEDGDGCTYTFKLTGIPSFVYEYIGTVNGTGTSLKLSYIHQGTDIINLSSGVGTSFRVYLKGTSNII